MANNFFRDQEDEEIVQGALPQPIPLEQPQQQPSLRDQLYKNLTEKYGLDARQKVIDENKTPEGFNWRALAGGIGTALQGQGAKGAADILDRQKAEREKSVADFDSQRQQILQDYEFEGDVEKANKERQIEADRQNPASERSRAAQQLLIQDFGFNPELASKMTAEQIESRIPTLKARLDREFKAGEAQADRDFKKGENALDRELRRRELQIKENESKNKGAEVSEGLKVLDREFAKDYNEWTSGGSKTAQTEINKLKGVIRKLKDGETSTGMFSGILPDRLTSNELLSARSDVQSTVMNSLRAILGAQFTEKEGERIIKNTWNESDSTENNIARLERLVGDLTSQAVDKDAKARYFNEHGTLVGFTPELGDSIPKQKTVAKKQYSKSRNQTRIIYDDGSSEVLDGRQ